MELDAAMGDLERATAGLESAPTDDLARIERALAERARALARLTALLEAGAPATAGSLDRLRAVYRSGALAVGKLRLERAALRAEIVRSAQGSYLLRAIAGGSPSLPRRLDCRG